MDNTKVKFAFLGGIYPDDSGELQNTSKVSLDYAADAYQKKYLSAFKDIGIEEIKIFSRLFVGSWPKNNKKINISSKGYSSFGDVEYINYFNVLGIRGVSQKNSTVNALKKWYKNLRSDELAILFVYSACFSKEIIALNEVCPNIKICIILPDLPKFTYLSDTSKLRKFITNRRQRNFQKSCLKSDYCICITEQMKRYVEKRTGIECCVIEAIANKERCYESLQRLSTLDNNECNDNKTMILYTGTLAKKYGILDLLEAFNNIENDTCELVICGGGDAELDIKKNASEDARINYVGIVPNTEAKRLQSKANILVNPRKPNDEFTAYSFPSKTIEYLETGNIVVCYKLMGIPEEYDNKICFAQGSDTLDLVNALKVAINMTKEDRIKSGIQNLWFLLNRKCGNELLEVIKLLQK